MKNKEPDKEEDMAKIQMYIVIGGLVIYLIIMAIVLATGTYNTP